MVLKSKVLPVKPQTHKPFNTPSSYTGGGIDFSSLLYPVLGLMSSPPTATWKGDDTTTIPSAVTYNQSSGVWRFLNATAPHASGYLQATPSVAQSTVVDTETLADSVDLRFIKTGAMLMVFVNRQPIALSNFVTDSSDTADLLQLRFAGTPLQGQLKRIRVYGINVTFGGAYITAGRTCTLPTNNRPVYAIQGDSYTVDAGAYSVGNGYARYCFEALGYDYVADGIGGTGYIIGVGQEASATRMANRTGILPYTPSRIGILQGYNDRNGSMTAIAASHVATVQAANTAKPNVPVDTWGPWTPLGETSLLLSVKNTLSGSSANRSKFFDISNIINSTNSSTYGLPSEAPNYTHPNAAGHLYLGQQMAIRGVLAGIKV